MCRGCAIGNIGGEIKGAAVIRPGSIHGAPSIVWGLGNIMFGMMGADIIFIPFFIASIAAFVSLVGAVLKLVPINAFFALEQFDAAIEAACCGVTEPVGC